jgi:uncharacterized protein YjbI with pentapeptide repeats
MAILCAIGLVVLSVVRSPAYIATNAVLILVSIASAAVGGVAGILATRQQAQSTRGEDVLKMQPPTVAVPRAREEHHVNRQQFDRPPTTTRQVLWILRSAAVLFDWPPKIRQVVWLLRSAAVLALLTVFILIGYRYGITLWDWIKLLIVPAVIAGGGLWFNAQQREREQHVEKEREQAEALQTYLEQISQLLVDRERPLHKAQPGDSLSTVARATTLNVLLRLDGERKRSVLLFLAEANLIGKSRPTIPLGGADLREALLHYADLSNTNLSGIDLSGASLFFANLYETDLSYADLSRANLNFAQMFRANLYKTDLSYADLSGALLMEANLSNTHLNNANLFNVIVSGADLRGVDLTGALGMSNDELEEQAAILEGAIMPNGQMYEDWLKSRGDNG